MAAETTMANQFRKPAKRIPRTSVRDLIPMNEVLLISNDGIERLPNDEPGVHTGRWREGVRAFVSAAGMGAAIFCR